MRRWTLLEKRVVAGTQPSFYEGGPPARTEWIRKEHRTWASRADAQRACASEMEAEPSMLGWSDALIGRWWARRGGFFRSLRVVPVREAPAADTPAPPAQAESSDPRADT